MRLEGITLQLCGELIRGDRVAKAIGYDCSNLYYQALGDFAHSLVFGDHVLLSRRQEPGSPGEHLLHQIDELFAGAITALEDTRPPLPQILQKKHFRENTASLIDELRYVVQPQSHLWCPWIIRESFLYLGKDSSLQSGNPDDFRFAKGLDFLKDSSLQQAIPIEVKNHLVRSLKSIDEDVVSPAAQLAFVERSLLTHISILTWYDSTPQEAPHKNQQPICAVPFPTRASLIGSYQEHAGQSEQLHALAMPYTLNQVLRSTVRPDMLLKSIQTVANSHPFPALRQLFAEAFDAYYKKTDSLAAKIFAELARVTKGEHCGPLITVKLSSISFGMPRYRWLLRQLGTASAQEIQRDNASHMRRLFPWLWDH